MIERDVSNAVVGWTLLGNLIEGEDRDDATDFTWDDGDRFGTAVSLTAPSIVAVNVSVAPALTYDAESHANVAPSR